MADKLDLDELLQKVRLRIEQGKWKRANPYVLDLIEILMPHANGMERSHVVSAMEARRRDKGLPIPKKFDEAVQSAFQSHAAGYATFRGRNAPASDDLFHSVGGKGSGIWAVNLARAKKWLQE